MSFYYVSKTKYRVEEHVIQAGLVGIGGSVVPVQQSKDVLWGENALPFGSKRFGSLVGIS